ncbi:inhibitor of apoptosis-promoting bax1 domain-containing protein [Ditylenchus destructor]|nr:inhibitor of apoptosis-promoting bax1 domain-containing protein [Ditylenchus destructor]
MNSCNIPIRYVNHVEVNHVEVNHVEVNHVDVNHVEAGVSKPHLGFDDKSIRAGFIRKVFLLLILMLFVVAAMTLVPFIYRPLIPFIRQNPALLYVSIALLVIIYFPMACASQLLRSYPQNIGCASLLVIAIGFITATISAFTEAEVVLLALAITFVSCVTVILFTLQTSCDFTSWTGRIILIALIILIAGISSILSIFVLKIHYPYIIAATLSAIIFMAWFAIDIQLIIGGRRHEISPEDYIFATIQLFVDIMIIFWLVLIIVALVAASDSDCNCSGGGCGSCNCSCGCDTLSTQKKERKNRDQGPVLENTAPIIAQPL